MIKKFKNMPKKIYVCEDNTVNLYVYQGTDVEEPVAPFQPMDYHIFVKDMGKPTVRRWECEVYKFDWELDEVDFFTTKKGCEEFIKKLRLDEVKNIKEKIRFLKHQLKELEI